MVNDNPTCKGMEAFMLAGGGWIASEGGGGVCTYLRVSALIRRNTVVFSEMIDNHSKVMVLTTIVKFQRTNT